MNGFKVYDKKQLIYISDKNKIVLLDESTRKELDYSIDSMKEIYEFVSKKG